MTYRSRMYVSVAVAFAVHAVAVLVPWDYGYPDAVANPNPASAPVVMQLQPQQPGLTPKRLVDTTEPSQLPIDEFTNLIAEENAKASDEFDIDSGENAPRMEEVDDAERLAAAKPVKPAVRPPTPPSPSAQPAPEKPKRDETAERMQVARNIPEPDVLERETSAAQAAAKAQEQVEAQPDSPASEIPEGKSRGRVEGGVTSRGFLNFEAKQHEFAPYLKVVRNRVERCWTQAILLRFSGTTPRKAVLDCAIAADGRIVEVTIVDSGGSGTYAEMCRQAVLDAGPFPPFPFDVPPGYRSQNIEIRWTFSYL